MWVPLPKESEKGHVNDIYFSASEHISQVIAIDDNSEMCVFVCVCKYI